jgi:hypothetical protein
VVRSAAPPPPAPQPPPHTQSRHCSDLSSCMATPGTAAEPCCCRSAAGQICPLIHSELLFSEVHNSCSPLECVGVQAVRTCMHVQNRTLECVQSRHAVIVCRCACMRPLVDSMCVHLPWSHQSDFCFVSNRFAAFQHGRQCQNPAEGGCDWVWVSGARDLSTPPVGLCLERRHCGHCRRGSVASRSRGHVRVVCWRMYGVRVGTRR